MKYLLIALILVAAAAGATYVRYQSFSPCDWMEQDLVEQTGLPRLIVQARIQADFLLQGITDPNPGECLVEWWKVRREGLPEQS